MTAAVVQAVCLHGLAAERLVRSRDRLPHTTQMLDELPAVLRTLVLDVRCAVVGRPALDKIVGFIWRLL